MVTIETQFLPSQFFFALHAQDGVCVEMHENYQKRSLRNRCIIAGPNGPQLLTIPLRKGKNQQMPITEVEISYDEDWPRKHVSALRTAYQSAPFYEHYIDGLKEVLLEKETFLFAMNKKLIDWFIYQLPNLKPILYTNAFYKNIGALDKRNRCNPRNYQQWDSLKYPQVFEDRLGFLPNLSMIDLLFCQGPAAGLMLKDFVTQISV